MRLRGCFVPIPFGVGYMGYSLVFFLAILGLWPRRCVAIVLGCLSFGTWLVRYWFCVVCAVDAPYGAVPASLFVSACLWPQAAPLCLVRCRRPLLGRIGPLLVQELAKLLLAHPRLVPLVQRFASSRNSFLASTGVLELIGVHPGDKDSGKKDTVNLWSDFLSTAIRGASWTFEPSLSISNSKRWDFSLFFRWKA